MHTNSHTQADKHTNTYTRKNVKAQTHTHTYMMMNIHYMSLMSYLMQINMLTYYWAHDAFWKNVNKPSSEAILFFFFLVCYYFKNAV